MFVYVCMMSESSSKPMSVLLSVQSQNPCLKILVSAVVWMLFGTMLIGNDWSRSKLFFYKCFDESLMFPDSLNFQTKISSLSCEGKWKSRPIHMLLYLDSLPCRHLQSNFEHRKIWLTVWPVQFNPQNFNKSSTYPTELAAREGPRCGAKNWHSCLCQNPCVPNVWECRIDSVWIRCRYFVILPERRRIWSIECWSIELRSPSILEIAESQFLSILSFDKLITEIRSTDQTHQERKRQNDFLFFD